MKNRIFTHLLIVALIGTITSCGSSGSKNGFKGTYQEGKDPIEEGYCLVFYKLDDFAKIYIDGKLIVDTSESVEMGSKEEVLVDLNNYLSEGKHQLKVELHNGICTDCNANRWAIFYELFNDGESVEFVSEDTDKHSDQGLKLSHSFELLVKK